MTRPPGYLLPLLCACVLLAFLAHSSGLLPTRGDETDYYKLSHSLHQGTGYAIPDGENLAPTRFPPVYPLVLSLFVPLEKFSPAFLALPGVIAFAGTLFLLFLRYRGSGWGGWLAALYAAHFFTLYLAFRLRSEHLFTLLVFGAMLLYGRFKAGNNRAVLAAAFLAALAAAYTRTIGWILPGVMLLLLLKDRRRDLLLPAALAAAAAFLYYLDLTDAGRYVSDIERVPKPHGQVYNIFLDVFVHFGRNVLDFFSGFWTAGITREGYPTAVFLAKTAASLALSLIVLVGLRRKIRQEGVEIEDVFFVLYPAAFCALGIYSDRYRYFLPVFPLALFYFLTALKEEYKLKPAVIRAVLWTLLPLYLLRTALSISQGSRYYN